MRRRNIGFLIKQTVGTGNKPVFNKYIGTGGKIDQAGSP